MTMMKSCFTCCTAGAEVSSEDEDMLAAAMMAQAAANKDKKSSDDGADADDEDDEPLAPLGNSGSGIAAASKTSVSKEDEASISRELDAFNILLHTISRIDIRT